MDRRRFLGLFGIVGIGVAMDPKLIIGVAPKKINITEVDNKVWVNHMTIQRKSYRVTGGPSKVFEWDSERNVLVNIDLNSSRDKN
jgi:hypothetical protein